MILVRTSEFPTIFRNFWLLTFEKTDRPFNPSYHFWYHILIKWYQKKCRSWMRNLIWIFNISIDQKLKLKLSNLIFHQFQKLHSLFINSSEAVNLILFPFSLPYFFLRQIPSSPNIRNLIFITCFFHTLFIIDKLSSEDQKYFVAVGRQRREREREKNSRLGATCYA